MTSGFMEGTENGVKVSIAIDQIICYKSYPEGKTCVYTTSNKQYSNVHYILLDQPYDVVNAMLQNYIDNQRRYLLDMIRKGLTDEYRGTEQKETKED